MYASFSYVKVERIHYEKGRDPHNDNIGYIL